MDKGLCAATNGFAIKLADELGSEEEWHDNVVFSPTCILKVLALLAAGACKKTFKLLVQIFLDSSSPINENDRRAVLVRIAEAVAQIPGINLHAKLYSSQVIEEEYLSLVKEVLEAEVQNLNFSNKAKAASTINSWVSESTDGEVGRVVTASDFDANTVLEAVAAFFFHGSWKQEFPARNTKKAPFTKLDGSSVVVFMMTSSSTWLTYFDSGLDVDVVFLPYEGSTLGALICLPRKVDGLPMLMKRLRRNTFSSWTKKVTQARLNLYLPKFSLRSKEQLDVALSRAYGLKSIYDENSADFCFMSHQRLHLSKIRNYAKLVVDERGTTAAAATTALVEDRSLVSGFNKLKFDHPFLFVVFDQSRRCPHLVACVLNPSTK